MIERIRNIFRRENRTNRVNPMPAGEWETWQKQTFEEDLLGRYLKRLGNDIGAKDVVLHPTLVRTEPKLHKLFLDTVLYEERVGLLFERWNWPLLMDGWFPHEYDEELTQTRTNMLRDPDAWVCTWYDNMVKLKI